MKITYKVTSDLPDPNPAIYCLDPDLTGFEICKKDPDPS